MQEILAAFNGSAHLAAAVPAFMLLRWGRPGSTKSRQKGDASSAGGKPGGGSTFSG
jgi:hypothetical protein